MLGETMRLKLLVESPERKAWSQPQNLLKEKQLSEAKRMHSRRRSRGFIISINIYMETACSARGTLTWKGSHTAQMAPPVTQTSESAYP